MLFHASQSRPVLTRRAASLLVLASVAACALPTFQAMLVAAEPADAKAADKNLTGRIFLIVSVRGKRGNMIVAVDPTTGKWQRIGDGADCIRVCVSPDKEMLGFVKFDHGVWTGGTREGSEPARIFDRGYPAGWSPDSKQIIVNDGKYEEGKGRKHEAWRMNVNGMDVTKLPIPEADSVHDWSPDGKWLVTVSDRHGPRGAAISST